MKILVLGAGLQGCAAAHNLLQHDPVETVTLADLHVTRLPVFLQPYLGRRLRPVPLDASDFAGVVALMNGHDATLCALPYYFNEPMTRAAIESGCHLCDLGGNTEIVFQQKKLHEVARSRNISIIPDCGLAPGMVNILAAEGIRVLREGKAVRVDALSELEAQEFPAPVGVLEAFDTAGGISTMPWAFEGKIETMEYRSEEHTSEL